MAAEIMRDPGTLVLRFVAGMQYPQQVEIGRILASGLWVTHARLNRLSRKFQVVSKIDFSLSSPLDSHPLPRDAVCFVATRHCCLLQVRFDNGG
jgi:hypothetical protein